MKPTAWVTGRRAVLFGLVVAGIVCATEYEINRAAIDGGGVMYSSDAGAAYGVSGTIGQWDAGTMTGGGYELTGGFWFALPPGDCNSDAAVSLLDHRDFVACMAGPGAGALSLQCRCFDLAENGTVDLADFALFAVAFTGG